MADNRNIEHPQRPYSYENIMEVTRSESYGTQMFCVNNTNT